MPDQAMPQGEQPQEGGASKLVADIFSGMNQLMAMMDQSQAVSPEDKQKLGTIMTAYQEFVESLGQAPGQPQQPAPGGPAPVMAGRGGAQPMV